VISAIDRFFRHVLYLDDNAGCWLWMARCERKGYGKFYMSRERKMVFAHRAAYEFAFGPIPQGMCVCHTCDIPPCVNPAHLFLGTNAENMADRDRKGRTRDSRGAVNTQAKLRDADVLEIRALHSGRNGAALGRRFGVTTTMISNIVNRKNWTHI